MKRMIGDRICLGNKNVADFEIALMQIFLTAAQNNLIEPNVNQGHFRSMSY